MEISTYLLETIKNQFEVFCIRVLQNEARDCYRELERLSKKMSLFSELNAEQLNGIGRMEEYDSDLYLFETNGYKIRVKNALIGEALSKLPKKTGYYSFVIFFGYVGS
jgi:hypothetical protein